MLLFPPTRPDDDKPANNPVPGKAVLATSAERLGVRSLDRPRGLAPVQRLGPASFAGGASPGDAFFIPREDRA